MHLRTHLALGVFALSVGQAASGCADRPEVSGPGRSPQSDDTAQLSFGDPNVTQNDCSTTACFDVESTKDLSDIEVDASACGGEEPSISLFQYGDQNALEPAQGVTVGVQGDGQQCAGQLEIDPNATKFDGLSLPHYVVCVTYSGVASPGSIEVYAKSGTTCEASSQYAGTCRACDGTVTGAGGSSSDGSGGWTGTGGTSGDGTGGASSGTGAGSNDGSGGAGSGSTGTGAGSNDGSGGAGSGSTGTGAGSNDGSGGAGSSGTGTGAGSDDGSGGAGSGSSGTGAGSNDGSGGAGSSGGSGGSSSSSSTTTSSGTGCGF